jgi:transcriptional regulator with XRE-family HTH domain
MSADAAGFGVRLKERRIELGLTQQQVADLVGSHVITVHGWENGAQPKTCAVVADIAEKLSVSFAWLAIGEGSKEPPGTRRRSGH